MEKPEIYLGNDLIEVSRILSLINTNGKKFLDRIFSKVEQEYCQSKQIPSIHYAGRFAAKEAIIKAIKSSGYIQPIPFNSIEIISGNNGEPIVKLGDQNYGKCRVSISHTEFIAMASAIYIIS
tara:strand:- start:62 stop:430 length:369 start_codon:yes stop_codon:yes gene_type:complete